MSDMPYGEFSRTGLIDMLEESEMLREEQHATISALRARVAELEAVEVAAKKLAVSIRIPVYGCRTWECYNTEHEAIEKLFEAQS